MDFTLRMQQIINILLETEQPVSVQSLADRMGLSKRTVQRELEYLGRPLKKHDMLFCSKTGVGVWLEGETKAREALRLLLNGEAVSDSSDREDRRKRLLLEILKDKTLKKLFYYSDMFGVSKATISSDLEMLEGWLADYGLQIVRTPGLGVSMEGSEQNFRRALRAFADENINTEIIREYYDDRNDALYRLVGNKSKKNIYHVLDREVLKRVIACVGRVNDSRIRRLTENSYVGLILHITIAVNRIMNQEIIEDNPDLLGQLRQDDDYRLSRNIVECLAAEFQILIPDVEIAYICLHIKGTKVQQYGSGDAREAEETEELLDMVNEMIERFDSELAYMLKQDEEFVVQGLIAHLKPTLIRLKNHMTIQNPLLDHIKQEYPDIYAKCEQVVKVIEERYGYRVPETETGFIAIHFGAALVRLEERKESKRKVYIGLVCASGIGISRLMLSRISRQFMDRIDVNAYGSYELNQLLTEKLDFIISTVPLKETVEVLNVSPLLTMEDMETIEKRVHYYERQPGKKTVENEFTRQLEQVNFVAAQIRNLIQELGYLKVDPAISFSSLLVEAADAFTPYQDQQDLIVHDIRKREKISSQVFPEFGFALLHNRSKGVTRPVFLVCVPQDHKIFLDDYFKGISVVIVMLLPEDEFVRENSEILGYLSEMLIEEYEFLEVLNRGGKQEIQDALTKYLKVFFHQYLEKM